MNPVSQYTNISGQSSALGVGSSANSYHKRQSSKPDASNPPFALSDLASLSPFSNNRNSVFRVVIIGGAFGGIHAAKELERQCTSRQLQITVIEKRDKYYYNPAALRAVAYPQIIPWLWLPYDHIFTKPKNRVIQGTVGAVLPEQVVLTDGRVFPYDALCVATGSEYPKPSKMDTPSSMVGMSEQFDFARKVKEADSILIIGGGATGVEMAGEIAAAYPKKEITIVHKQSHLLNGEGNSKFRERVYKELLSMNVNVVLNERAVIPDDDPLTYEIHPRWIKTSSGREIFSDLQFLCSGVQTRSEFMYSLVPNQVERIINPQNGEIKVRPTMQIAHPDFPHIFGAGDCTNVPGQKLAGKADSQGKHVGACIAKMFKAWKKGRENWKHISLPTWEDPTYRISISLGAQGGITHTPWILLGAWATRFIKSKDLFLLKRYREFGLYYDPKWRKMVEDDHDPFGAPAWCPPVNDQDYLQHLSQTLKNHNESQYSNKSSDIVHSNATKNSVHPLTNIHMMPKSIPQNVGQSNNYNQQFDQMQQQMQQLELQKKSDYLQRQILQQQQLLQQQRQQLESQGHQQFQPIQLRQVYMAPDGRIIDPQTMSQAQPHQQLQQQQIQQYQADTHLMRKASVRVHGSNGNGASTCAYIPGVSASVDSLVVRSAVDQQHREAQMQMQQQDADEYEKEEREMRINTKMPPSFLSGDYNRLSDVSYLNDQGNEDPALTDNQNTEKSTTDPVSGPASPIPNAKTIITTAPIPSDCAVSLPTPISATAPFIPTASKIYSGENTSAWVDDEDMASGTASTVSFPANNAHASNGGVNISISHAPSLKSATTSNNSGPSYANNGGVFYGKAPIQGHTSYQLPKGYKAHLEPTLDINANLLLSNQLTANAVQDN